jgi:hypothetical protein
MPCISVSQLQISCIYLPGISNTYGRKVEHGYSDVVETWIKLVETGHLFNISTSKATGIRELVDKIERSKMSKMGFIGIQS